MVSPVLGFFTPLVSFIQWIDDALKRSLLSTEMSSCEQKGRGRQGQARFPTYLAKSRSASRDIVMLVKFCWRMKMFLHIFLMPDSLMRLKYWAPLMRMQEIKWPKPRGRSEKSKNWKRKDI